jgi:hypothetical protein
MTRTPEKREFVSTSTIAIPRMARLSGETNNEVVTTAPTT